MNYNYSHIPLLTALAFIVPEVTFATGVDFEFIVAVGGSFVLALTILAILVNFLMRKFLKIEEMHLSVGQIITRNIVHLMISCFATLLLLGSIFLMVPRSINFFTNNAALIGITIFILVYGAIYYYIYKDNIRS